MPVALADRLRSAFRRSPEQDATITEAALGPQDAKIPERLGYAPGIPPGGLTEYRQAVGASTQSDRRSSLIDLYGAYLSCPWVWAAANAIARTITAGGLVTDFNGDTGEGDQAVPDKPPAVLALERLLGFCNPNQDIRQIARNIVIDLLVFGDAYVEVSWLAGVPVALYNLDCPTMYPKSDEHGNVTGYVQITEYGQRAVFTPNQVIHIGLDAPRSGVFGVSPTQAAMLPITAWLHAAATGKELMRKGLPPMLHVDFPAGKAEPEQNRWLSRFMTRNVGPRNIGMPVATAGGGVVRELAVYRVNEVQQYLDQKRDEILASFGVPPAKAGVIESGNLGSGTGETQDRTFKVNTCQPIAELILEKFNFHLTVHGFGITDWHLKFKDVDYRSSQVIEDVRDMRLRNGSWTLNRYRAEIGEPPVEGGDDPVLIDRQNLVVWADIAKLSAAIIAGKGAPAVAAGEAPPNGEPLTAAADGEQNGDPEADQVPETVPPEWTHEYRRRLREARRELAGVGARDA